jgi:hypothetical protein
VALTAHKLASLEALRTELQSRFGEKARALEAPARDLFKAPALGTGIEAVDAILPAGGLRPGESALLDCPPGAGGLELVSAWARNVCLAGEAVAVVDPSPTCLPHPWIEPAPTSGTIWVITPQPREAWAATDILLRSGGFGLVILLDLPPLPRGGRARLLRLLQTRGNRLVLRGSAPFRPTFTLELRARGIEWATAPVGEAPAASAFMVACEGRIAERRRDSTLSDRLRSASPAPDRRGANRGQGRARRPRE